MYNSYTIEIKEVDKQIKAVVYLGKDCLGTIWRPKKDILHKNEFRDLFESIGDVLYGQEAKADKLKQQEDKFLDSIIENEKK